MTAVFFFYGLAFFTMGLAVVLEARRASALALGHQLRWLAAFGFVHSLVEWADMFLLIYPAGPLPETLVIARTLLLPLSALLLVRFGIGLVAETGQLPKWLTLAPPSLFVPGALVIAYGLVVALTAQHVGIAADVWSRYLLYFPGSLLAALGFVRQSHGLPGPRLGGARRLLLGAAVAFGFNALVAGLIVPAAPYGLAPWLNYDRVLVLTAIPVQFWRALSAVAVTVFVVRGLGVFEAERQQEIADLQEARVQAQQAGLQAQYDARREAERWTDGLVSVSRRIATMGRVDDVLVVIVDLARQLMASDAAALALFYESGTRLELRCRATAAGAQTIDPLPVTSRLILELARARRSFRCPEDVGAEPDCLRCSAIHQESAAAAVVPLRLDGRALGALWVTRSTAQSYNLTDLLSLERLADQAVIALQHASMAERLQSLAVIAERERIAREMHDGMAQVLGYLNLQASIIAEQVAAGHCAAAQTGLLELKQVAREAYTDAREAIFSLRNAATAGSGLLTMLEAYLKEYRTHYGVDASLVVEDGATVELAPSAEIQITRIIQEAMTNVRKHAAASKACVRFRHDGDQVWISVEDDGRGFDQGRVMEQGQRYFGLQIMRERAESIGGSIAFDSQPGRGTRVLVRVPVTPRSEEPNGAVAHSVGG